MTIKNFNLENLGIVIIWVPLILFVIYDELSEIRYSYENVITDRYPNGNIKEEEIYENHWNWLGHSEKYLDEINTFWENGNEKENSYYLNGILGFQTYENEEGNFSHFKDFRNGIKMEHIITEKNGEESHECEYHFSKTGESLGPFFYKKYDHSSSTRKGIMIDSVYFLSKKNLSTIDNDIYSRLSDVDKKLFDYCLKNQPNYSD